jgi:DNA-binding transcriptional MerR regulator
LTSIECYFILYRMTNAEQKDLLKISELARAAEVSVSTIHYYVQQGLLTPPVKTSRNMAYYHPECVQEIRLVQELQTKKYLPLSAIKLIIKARKEGQNIEHVQEMQYLMEEVFRPAGKGMEQINYSFEELLKGSGLSESDFKELEAGGIIKAQCNKQGLFYDDIDLQLARIFKKLLDFGFKCADFNIYSQYMDIMRQEAIAVHDAFHRLPDHEKVPLREFFKTIHDFKDCLEMKVFRQESQSFQAHHFNKENK